MSYSHKVNAGSKTPADGLAGKTDANQYRGADDDGDADGEHREVGDRSRINNGRPLKTGGRVRQGDPSSHHAVPGRKHGGRVKR